MPGRHLAACLLVASLLLAITQSVRGDSCNAVALARCISPTGTGAIFCAAFTSYYSCAVMAGCSSDSVVASLHALAVSMGCNLPETLQPVIISLNNSLIISGKPLYRLKIGRVGGEREGGGGV